MFVLLIYVILISKSLLAIENLAVIINPVVNATSYPLSRLSGAKKLNSLYDSFSFCPEIGTYSCLRVHQFIFNEIVKVKKELPDEVECEAFNFYYLDSNNNKIKTAWTTKKNLIYLKDIAQLTDSIPTPYNPRNLKNILTLVDPWSVYSAGTRFVRVAKKDRKLSYAIRLFNPATLKNQLKFIPKNKAIVNYPKNFKSARKLFLNILKKWAENNSGIIPYVWGGCSYTKRYHDYGFSLVRGEQFGEKIFYWKRKKINSLPYTGFDCSGLLLRAAQICGLNYYLKNTATIEKILRPLDLSSEILEEGDLIWYPGHIIVISDIKLGKAIESVGYQSGHGKLHEIEISKIFKNVKNYQDLLTLYKENKLISRLDISGKVYSRLNLKGQPYSLDLEFKILKLSA